jgi:hypothetical protein
LHSTKDKENIILKYLKAIANLLPLIFHDLVAQAGQFSREPENFKKCKYGEQKREI